MRRLLFLLERQLLRGAHVRLALIAVILATCSLVGGLLALLASPADFAAPGEAIWWAFLRLTDPGYLGDDQGLAKRAVSTALTLLGYVVFLGALVAIMTQWLNATLTQLARGETPIALQGHLLVVGWSERSAAVIEEFLFSDHRVRNFLRHTDGVERVRVVLLIEDLDPTVQAEVKERLGPAWDSRVILLRAGSRLKLEHLERVAFHDAAAIVLPGNHESETELLGAADVATVKTLLSIARHPLVRGAHPPRVVAELNDHRKATLADVVYPGSIDVIPTDLHLARLMVQSALNPGLAAVVDDLLSFRFGAALYVAPYPQLAGLCPREAAARFDRTVMLGFVRDGRAHLGLHGTEPLRATDAVVVVASAVDVIRVRADGLPREVGEPEPIPTPTAPLRALCVGWSERVPTLIAELGRQGREVAVDVLAGAPIEGRQATLASYSLPDTVAVQHLLGDYTVPATLRALDIAAYDAIFVLGSARALTNEEMDARALVAWLSVHKVLADDGPPVLVEISDPRNEALFAGRPAEVMVTTRLISNLLAHVTLRRELLTVYEALFSPGCAALRFRPAAAYELGPQATFAEVQAATARRGHIALGVRHQRAITLVPEPARSAPLDEALVLVPGPGDRAEPGAGPAA